MKIIFVCTVNIQRSPTAADVMKKLLGKGNYDIESAGIEAIEEWGGRQITKEMIQDADLIYVMEEFQADYIVDLVPSARDKIRVLNIPDMFYRNDPKLIEILKEKLEPEVKRIKETLE